MPDAATFIADVRRNRYNAALLDRLPALALRDCWLVAGCLFQTIWNLRGGDPAEARINDYDVFYCDDRDLSYAAEDRNIRRAGEAFADLPVRIELRNQARVHLWFAERFGTTIAPLVSSRQSIGQFLVACTCVGVGCNAGEEATVAAPYGLDDLYGGVLRANPSNPTPDRFPGKVESYQARWPWLVRA